MTDKDLDPSTHPVESREATLLTCIGGGGILVRGRDVTFFCTTSPKSAALVQVRGNGTSRFQTNPKSQQHRCVRQSTIQEQRHTKAKPKRKKKKDEMHVSTASSRRDTRYLTRRARLRDPVPIITNNPQHLPPSSSRDAA